ncbi:MAG: amidohydrolase family protein [Ruminococcaceae bacterium]|nr:amidohydrolase family protein [Oscillospiraceae bacterium]
MTTLLKGGKIYDGTGKDPYTANILIENDRIKDIGKIDTANKIIDITGLSVAPGFIDAHSHNDWFAIKKEPQPYFDPFIRQGITTFVAGNCGLSSIGFNEGSPHVDKLGGGLFHFRETTGKYGTVNEFLKAIDKKSPCNMTTLVGHCSARAAVSGYKTGKLSASEEKEMLEILDTALENGAAGISLGMMYEPGIYADVEELKKVAALCVKHNKPLTVHPRAESKVSMAYPELFGRSHLLRAVDELVEVAKGTPLKLHISHAIFVGRKTFKDQPEFIKIINQLRSEGVDAMFDIYNETVGVSVITVVLPAWYQGMSLEERNKPLTKFKLNILVKATSALLGFGFNDIVIAYIGKGYEKYEGKTISEAAKMDGISNLDMYLNLCEYSDFKGRVNMGPYSTPEIIKEFSHNDNCLYMTDAWVEDFGVQNPAIYDCFSKFLRDSLIGIGDTMQKTIRKMSGATADRFMIKDRGYLIPNYFADITIFNEDELKKATPDQEKSFGIEKVFINGKLVLDNNKIDKTVCKTSGRAISV